MSESDPFDLDRFVSAQSDHYEQALAELSAGAKQSHWMWFIFPQLRGLGTSAMAQRYAISGADEARAYLRHPLLGPRLIACAQAMLDVGGRTAGDILGTPDDLKLRSSMTLFAQVSELPIFGGVLDRYYGGTPDRATLRLLAS